MRLMRMDAISLDANAPQFHIQQQGVAAFGWWQVRAPCGQRPACASGKRIRMSLGL